ncbi:MAG: exodeoxyribonuclease V subunit alpha [Balneolaceae bacterium]|nr:exodeoxyribonuclease V subunit alpha [Balneolaceae bacterium]
MKKLKKLENSESLSAIDVAVCSFLKDTTHSVSDEVLIAAALVSYKYREGDVCLELDDSSLSVIAKSFKKLEIPSAKELLKALRKSPVVGKPGDFKPLILEDDKRLYLHKLWKYERMLADHILTKSRDKQQDIDLPWVNEKLDQLFQGGKSDIDTLDWQKVAAVLALLNNFTVISGGPGTGKTTTVIRILALLIEQAMEKNKEISVALAAPTGKAASRLKASLSGIKSSLLLTEEVKQNIPDEAVTIHQLLGARRHSSKYKYHADNPLPLDVLIIDEASMIDQVLMSKLMDALLEDTKLILLGDKDQLSSVEAGSVLGNICNLNSNSISESYKTLLETISLQIPDKNIETTPKPLTDNIILLQKNYRFDEQGGIAMLSDHIKNGRGEEAVSVLQDSSIKDASIEPVEEWESFKKELQKLANNYLEDISNCTDATDYFEAYNEQGLLTAHRKGFLGVEFLNEQVELYIKQKKGISVYQKWYEGRPVIINKNDYNLGLYNGDIGICTSDPQGTWQIMFLKDGGTVYIAPSRLPDFDIAYALTIHKSQGSEFGKVALIVPDEHSKLLSRELLYTGISRARKAINIYGSSKVFKKGIQREIHRSSGLKNKLWHS